MRFTFHCLLCVAAMLATISCDADKTTPTQQQPQQAKFRDLQDKDDVPFNVQLCYNQRRFDQYDKLLDGDFRFYFSHYDKHFRGAPEYWERDVEVWFTNMILDNPGVPDHDRILSVNLKLDYPDSNWTGEPAPQSHEGETWYTQLVPYELRVKTSTGWEFRSVGQNVDITIRWDDGLGHWRVVRILDGRHPVPRQLAPVLGVKPIFWGTLKTDFTADPLFLDTP